MNRNICLVCNKTKKYQRCWKKCRQCNKSFVSNNSVIGFCSFECKKESFNWKYENIYRISSIRKSYQYKILERDKYTCRRCGNKKDWGKRGVHVHHIIPRKFGGNESPENLICLCVGCHTAVHKNPKKNKEFIKV